VKKRFYFKGIGYTGRRLRQTTIEQKDFSVKRGISKSAVNKQKFPLLPIRLMRFVQRHREFPFSRWQIPGPLLENSRKFPFRINDCFYKQTRSLLPECGRNWPIFIKCTKLNSL